MKNIIIAGPSRTGKTTLANKINEELHCFVLGLDKVAAAFGRAYPKLDIRLNWNYRKTTDNIAPFLGHFLGVFSSSQHCFEDEQNLRAPIIKGNQFVLEGAYFNFEINVVNLTQNPLTPIRKLLFSRWFSFIFTVGLNLDRTTDNIVYKFIK